MTELKQGRITAVDDTALTATLTDEAGNAHVFTQAQWDGVGRPVQGAAVLFRLKDGKPDLVGLAESTARRRWRIARRLLGAIWPLLFSFGGRIGRARFNIAVFGIWLPVLLLFSLLPSLLFADASADISRQLAAKVDPTEVAMPGGLRALLLLTFFSIIAVWISLIGLALRRVRDMGYTGWWLLAPIALGTMGGTTNPVAGKGLFTLGSIALVLALMFHPSRPGPAEGPAASSPPESHLRRRVRQALRKRRDR